MVLQTNSGLEKSVEEKVAKIGELNQNCDEKDEKVAKLKQDITQLHSTLTAETSSASSNSSMLNEMIQ